MNRDDMNREWWDQYYKRTLAHVDVFNTKVDKLRDFMTWYLCYEKGLREPRYPVPAVRYEWEWYMELLTKDIHLYMITYGTYEG
jgi:hypothetical protein